MNVAQGNWDRSWMCGTFLAAFLFVMVGSGCSGTSVSNCTNDTDCPGTEVCVDGQCSSHLCRNVVCDQPPGDPSCYNLPGSCNEGQCNYTPATGRSCNDDDPCTELDSCQVTGVCAGQPLRCDQPPNAYCQNETTLIQASTPGVCYHGLCDYDLVETTCDSGCLYGECQGNSCADVVCDQSPPPECKGNSLRVFQATGSCSNGVCQYDFDDEFCALGCSDGACVADACQGVVCNDPPQNACLDESTLYVYVNLGQCRSGECAYPGDGVDCPNGCEYGACLGQVCGNGVVEPGEACDGDCPTDCDDGQVCTQDLLLGSSAQCDVTCENVPITDCQGGDGCCPWGCNSANDSDCASVCGNSVVEDGEACDGDCPTDCDDGKVCTEDILGGNSAQCNVSCQFVNITGCEDNDGCCPSGCNSLNDNDCENVCGNGVVEDGETCDGNCPTDCDDGQVCTEDILDGDSDHCDVTCQYQAINICLGGDGCCPWGCNAGNDTDCTGVCGNGVVEGGEACDGNCPTACDDGNVCTEDILNGMPAHCDVSCQFVPISVCKDSDGCCPSGCYSLNDSDCAPACGNNVVEDGETCDGNCNTYCNDGQVCTTDTLTGSAAQCSAACQYQPIDQCVNGDGCCPMTCNSLNDTDCTSVCGNDVVEAGETCDGDCPTDCYDGQACTQDISHGTPAHCNVTCEHPPVDDCQGGDGCCPVGCNANSDSDCSGVCGNGVVESGEACDGNCPSLADCNDNQNCTEDTLNDTLGDCNVSCQNAPITDCTDGDGCCPSGCHANNDTDCDTVCGNGVIEPGEICDGNCPEDCDDGSNCTDDHMTGSACNVVCSHEPACDSGEVCIGQQCEPVAFLKISYEGMMTCPTGYDVQGIWKTGPYLLDHGAEGYDSEGNEIDAGWMWLCSVDRNKVRAVAYINDCNVDPVVQCDEDNIRGMWHAGDGTKCDENHIYGADGTVLQSGWMALCVGDGVGAKVEADANDCGDEGPGCGSWRDMGGWHTGPVNEVTWCDGQDTGIGDSMFTIDVGWMLLCTDSS